MFVTMAVACIYMSFCRVACSANPCRNNHRPYCSPPVHELTLRMMQNVQQAPPERVNFPDLSQSAGRVSLQYPLWLWASWRYNLIF